MFLKIHYIFFIIFLIFSSNIKSAPDSNSISKDEKDARFTESTEELIVRAVTIDPATHPGNLLYQENCAGCHNGTVEKAPATNWLEALIPQALFRTMNQGIMMEQSSHLTEEEKILACDLPASVVLEISYTEPGIKGDTATNALKSSTVETGAKVNVPLFINIGDKIKIDTRSGTYSERVKS